jgi:NADPH:quinone reductase-like Zn-dependent oxidoreductase
VLEATGGAGVDLVVDNVGAATWGQSLRAVRRGGRVVTCGATTGGDPPAELQRVFIRQIQIQGSTFGSAASRSSTACSPWWPPAGCGPRSNAAFCLRKCRDAARLVGRERQSLRDGIVRYNAEGLAGLHDALASAG